MTEDFTTFNEHDYSAKYTIHSSTSLSFAGVNGTVYGVFLHKDYTSDYFDDFEIENEFTIHHVTTGQQGGGLLVWGLTNIYNDNYYRGTAAEDNAMFNSNAFYGGVTCYLYFPTSGATNFQIRLYNNRYPASQTDIYPSGATQTAYYMTYDRSGPTTSAYIYSDASRTILEDTLTIEGHTDAYRFMYAFSAYNTLPNSYNTWNGEIKNLNIVSVTNKDWGTISSVKAYSFQLFTASGSYCEIEDSRHVNFFDFERVYNNYIYRDFGADAWDIEQWFYVNSRVTDAFWWSAYGGEAGIFGMSETCLSGYGQIACWNNNDEGDFLHWDWAGTSVRTYVRSFYGGGTGDSSSVLNIGRYYFFKIYKNKSTGLFTVYIYDEDDRITLIDTITMTTNAVAQRYIYVCQNYYDSSYNWAELFGNTEYLKNINVVCPTAPSESTEVNVPDDGSGNAEWPVTELAVDIDESESNVTIYFYNSNNELIDVVESSGGNTAGTNWGGLNCGEVYGWYVVIDNGYSTATSETWYFTCGPCDVFTIASESYPTIHFSPPLWNNVDRKLQKRLSRFAFWSESWAVHDEGIDSEHLVLKGIEHINENDDEGLFQKKFTDVDDIMNLHEEIAISGLGDCIDGYYVIKNFKHKTIPGFILCREWTLTLEFSREKTW